MTLTKDRITHDIYNQCGLSKQKSVEVLESLLETIKQALESGEDVLISGFGKFSVREKNRRVRRNPKTGEDVMIGTRRVVMFRCSGVLRDSINGK